MCRPAGVFQGLHESRTVIFVPEEYMAYQKIFELLRQHHITFTLHEHEAVRTIDDARKKAPYLVDRLIKTIVFTAKHGDWILAGVPCTERIDYRKLAAVLEINRRQLRSVSPGDVERELGFEVGGVGPFPVQDNVRVILDGSLGEYEVVCCGSGKNTRTLELTFHDLLRVTNGQMSPIIRNPC